MQRKKKVQSEVRGSVAWHQPIGTENQAAEPRDRLVHTLADYDRGNFNNLLFFCLSGTILHPFLVFRDWLDTFFCLVTLYRNIIQFENNLKSFLSKHTQFLKVFLFSDDFSWLRRSANWSINQQLTAPFFEKKIRRHKKLFEFFSCTFLHD